MNKKRGWIITNSLLVLILVFLSAQIISQKIEANKFKTKIEGASCYENVVMFPEPTSLVDLKIDTLGAKLPKSKEDGKLPVIFDFTINGATLETYGVIKIQGTSTAHWPKKNWSLKFYEDEERTKEYKIKIGDSVPSDKWVIKSEWVDPTISRNALAYRLWGAMVNSRNQFPKNEVDNAWLAHNNLLNGTPKGAQGFPKTYPTEVRMNEEHYGLSMLILGHDPANFNINEASEQNMYVSFDGRDGSKTKNWDKFSGSSVDSWIEGYYPLGENMNAEHLKSLEDLGNLINGTPEAFKTEFDQHLDKLNMIDMLLFLEAIYDYDGVAQDIEMVTYDLKKWYMFPWDKDTTFGAGYDDKGIINDSAQKLLIDYDRENPEQKPWYKTYQAFTPEVEARYAQLRDEDIFSVNGLYQIIEQIVDVIPPELWQAEVDRWEAKNRPSINETSSAQIISWFEERLKLMDKQFNYSNDVTQN